MQRERRLRLPAKSHSKFEMKRLIIMNEDIKFLILHLLTAGVQKAVAYIVMHNPKTIDRSIIVAKILCTIFFK
jgi:hypothetical protein